MRQKPEIAQRLFCATPSVALSRKISRKKTFEMLATGEFISAQESLAQGLVNRAAPLGELQAATDVLLTQILSKPRLALCILLYYRQLKVGRQAACKNAADTLACHLKNASAPWGR